MNDQDRKNNLLTALHRFIAQRPGLEFANYGNVSAYRSEMRGITRDRHQAETLLTAVSLRNINADQIIAASRNAFSGRLTITETELGKFSVDYCAGQYFPTECRRAVCAVLASALWDYFRENMPKGELRHNSETGETLRRYDDMRAGDWLRAQARKELGRTIAQRWFN